MTTEQALEEIKDIIAKLNEDTGILIIQVNTVYAEQLNGKKTVIGISFEGNAK